MKKDVSIYTTWPLIVALLLLLTNDFYFKEMYSNWFTGKLSDFSGIFLISILLFSYFPKRIKLTLASITMLFIFWKSPYSQSIIEIFNVFDFIHFARVVDYSDVIAFSVMPLSLYISRHISEYQINSSLIPTFKIPIVILVVFAITATTAYTPIEKYEIRKNSSDQKIDINKAIKAVAEIAKSFQMNCIKCQAKDENVIYENKKASLSYSFLPYQRGLKFRIQGKDPGLYFGTDPKIEMHAIKISLQNKFGAQFKNMEFVVQLPITNSYILQN